MKILAVLVTLAAAASLFAQPTPPAKAVGTKAATPTTKSPAKKTDGKTEPKAEEPKIPGANVVRADGTYLGLEVVGGKFKLSFYDKKKKLIAPNVTRASARWPNPRSPGDSRTVLNVSGNALIGAKPVMPPFVFNVYITLLQGEGAEAKAVESFVIPFRG